MRRYLGFAGEHYYAHGGGNDYVASGRRLDPVKWAVERRVAEMVYVVDAKPAFTWTQEMLRYSTADASIVGTHVDAQPARVECSGWGHVLILPDAMILPVRVVGREVEPGHVEWHFAWGDE